MNSKQLGSAFIIGGIAIAVIFFGTIYATEYMTQTQQAEHMAAMAQEKFNYCADWSLQIEERRSHLNDDWIYSQYKWDQFNEQVEDYNEQCATTT